MLCKHGLVRCFFFFFAIGHSYSWVWDLWSWLRWRGVVHAYSRTCSRFTWSPAGAEGDISIYWKFFESFSWHWTFDDIKQKTFFIFSVFKDLVICWRTEQGDMRENSRRLQPSEASLQNNALQRFTWTKNNTRNVSETVLVVSMFSLRTVKIWFSSRQAFQFQITRNQPKKNMFARSLPLFLRVKIVANQSCQVIMIEHSRNDSFSGWWWWWCPP